MNGHRMKGRVFWVIGLASLVLSGCSVTPGNSLIFFPEGHRLIDAAKQMRQASPDPWPLPRELQKRPLPPYVVEPGDVLLLQPADLESAVRLPGDQPVLPDGTITLGRYGPLIVAGKTVAEIEAAARGQVVTYLTAHQEETKDAAAPGAGPKLPDPKEVGPITVRIVTRVSKVYYVLGEVNAPGAFTLNGRETVLDAILAAGGLTDRASRRNIILSRPTHPNSCRMVLPVCYNEIVQLGDTSTNYQLAPGDRIYVPTRTFWEELYHNQPECPPCGRPQVPCAPPVHVIKGQPDAQPAAGPFLAPAPGFGGSEPTPKAPDALPQPRPLGQGQVRRTLQPARLVPTPESWWQRVAAVF